MSPSDRIEDTARPPVLYRRPTPLSAERHADHRVETGTGHGFAAEINSLPLNAVEFVPAARHYPIVFTLGEEPVPVAILGLGDGRNLFIRDGRWERGLYIPAYVRRYPFIFTEHKEAGQLVLCIDEAAPSVTTEARGERLIVDGEPSEFARRALEFCTAFQREVVKTHALVELLKQRDLLTRRMASLRRGEEERSLGGFQAVDEAKFNALDDATMLDWRRRGFLPILYAHLLSLGNWESLSSRDSRPGTSNATLTC